LQALRRAGGNIGQTRALSAAEQSLIEFYQKVRSSSSERQRLGEIERPAVDESNQTRSRKNVPEPFRERVEGRGRIESPDQRGIPKAVNDADRGKEIWRIRPEPPSLLAQEWLNRRWLALPVISLAVDKTGSTSRPGDYCYVNDHWVLVPPLRTIEAMQLSTAARSGQ
jgi:hypothetical protein